MTPEEFEKQLSNMATHIQTAITNELPEVVGKIAVDFFKEGFQEEGFTDTSIDKWQEVNRRKPGYKGKGHRTNKILTGGKDLGESIEWKDSAPGEVIIYSDKEYAAAHNEGTTTAGRNRSVTIPKRQFMGHSHELDKQITAEIDKKMKEILGNK